MNLEKLTTSITYDRYIDKQITINYKPLQNEWGFASGGKRQGMYERAIRLRFTLKI